MRINTIYWWVLSCLLTNSLIKAQSFSVEKADSLFNVKQFEASATAYEKVFFFSRNTDQRVIALFKRANCFKQMDLHYEAYRSLVRVLEFDINDSIKCAAQYEVALSLYLTKYFTDAEKFCARNRSLPVNTVEYKRSILLHGLILNELNKYSEASAKLKEYNQNANISILQKDSLNACVDLLYKKKGLPKLKSVRKARRLSKCLPGAGLFYAGKPGKALLNISLQLVALGYTGANVYIGNYATAATAGLYLMKSFYIGGVNQLNEIVPKVNYKRSKKFNDKVRNSYLTKLKNYNAY